LGEFDKLGITSFPPADISKHVSCGCLNAPYVEDPLIFKSSTSDFFPKLVRPPPEARLGDFVSCTAHRPHNAPVDCCHVMINDKTMYYLADPSVAQSYDPSWHTKLKQIDCWGLRYGGFAKKFYPMTTEETACYLARYEDLRNNAAVSDPQNNFEGAKKHWKVNGIWEGRSKSCEFKSKKGNHCSNEHRMCKCIGNVYFGKDDSWIMRPSRNMLQPHAIQQRACAAWDFGGHDPAPGVSKNCYCDEAQALDVQYGSKYIFTNTFPPKIKYVAKHVGKSIPYNQHFRCAGTAIMVSDDGWHRTDDCKLSVNTMEKELGNNCLCMVSPMAFPTFAPGKNKYCLCYKTPYIA